MVSAVNLLALILVFMTAGKLLFDYLTQMLTRYLGTGAQLAAPPDVGALLTAAMGDYLLLMSPVFLTAVLAGLAVNYLQVVFLFTTEPLAFKLERLNPVEGFKRVVSRRSLLSWSRQC